MVRPLSDGRRNKMMAVLAKRWTKSDCITDFGQNYGTIMEITDIWWRKVE